MDGGATKWYPGDADAGLIARQQFYMAVRYDGNTQQDSLTTDLELFPGNPSDGLGLGDFDRLLEWHYEAPPENFERRRNQRIFDSYQFNRNPFVDRPEFVWSVFVDQQNDTRLSLAGASVGADGGSTLSIDLGRSYVGQSVSPSTTVALEKSGDDGTYFRATATGAASTPLTDSFNAFGLGAAPDASAPIDLAVNTSTAGQTVGSVVFDNLDVTTGGGLGVGAQDSVDVVDLTYTVVDHPLASFAAAEAETALTIDFGSVPIQAAPISIAAEIFNFDGAGAPTLAADLDLDSILASGDTGSLSTDLAPAFGFSQGSALAFNAILDPSLTGDFEAVYTLNLSGEDLPGEQTQQLTLTLVADVVAAALAGDYNGDGFVDSGDFVVWRESLGSTADLRADGNGSGAVDAADFTIWRENFGQAAAAALSVPEPATWLILACGLALSGRRSTSRCS